MHSSITVAFLLLLFPSIPSEINFNRKEYGDRSLTIPFSSGQGSEYSSLLLCNNWLEVLGSSHLDERVHNFSFAKVRVYNSIYGNRNCSLYAGAGAKMLHCHNKVHSAMDLKDETTSNTSANNSTSVLEYESFLFMRYNRLDVSSMLSSHEQQPFNEKMAVLQNRRKRPVDSLMKVATRDLLVHNVVNVIGDHPHSKAFPGNFTDFTCAYTLSGFSMAISRRHLARRKAYYPHFTEFVGIYGRTALGLIFISLLIITGIYSSVKNQQLKRHKSKIFQKNGGLLLQQHFNASASRGSTNIFTFDELEQTMHFHKKSHTFGPAEDYEVQRFVNDIITLTQINHRNVVKFFGCCLETESPILVYELVSNGTLFDYIHQRNVRSSFPWDTLLKIASESAAALAYLHSASIIHGNVRSSNILLTDCFTAKVIGFGPSRLVPSNETQISTLFQRTLGYLDPEYLHRGQLTYKSDVYSFGMVLLEIVTGGERPVSFGRPESQRIMASHFVSSRELQGSLLDHNVGNLGIQVKEEQVRAVAELAKRCLSLSSADRPAMHEVARELTLLRS